MSDVGKTVGTAKMIGYYSDINRMFVVDAETSYVANNLE